MAGGDEFTFLIIFSRRNSLAAGATPRISPGSQGTSSAGGCYLQISHTLARGEEWR
jgi:hypothetical protein